MCCSEPLPRGPCRRCFPIPNVREWLARPQVQFLTPGPEHVGVALRLLERVGTGASLTTDAQLAAYAVEFGGTIHSNDADFGRFAGVPWVDPLR